MTTYNGFLWRQGTLNVVAGSGALGGPGWVYCHNTPELTILLNPIRANDTTTNLWVCEASGKTLNLKDVKQGWEKVRPVSVIPKPIFTKDQLLSFGYKCFQGVTGSYLKDLDDLKRSDNHDFIHYSVAQLVIQAAYCEEFNVDFKSIIKEILGNEK